MTGRSFRAAALAGLVYFAAVFAAGFALGVLRILVVVPRFGEAIAVLLELPIVLTLAWFACRWSVRRFGVPGSIAARGLMGGTAFAILMMAELSLATLGFGMTVAEHFARYERLAERLGLAGQVLFAACPVIQLMLAPRT
jgi:hypothetical protein